VTREIASNDPGVQIPAAAPQFGLKSLNHFCYRAEGVEPRYLPAWEAFRDGEKEACTLVMRIEKHMLVVNMFGETVPLFQTRISGLT
jgi:hypothetical protein